MDGAGRCFDDLLTEIGAPTLSAQMLGLIDAAIGIADGFEADLPDLLAENRLALQPLYDAVKDISDLLKTQLLTTLDLEVPNRAEGDND